MGRGKQKVITKSLKDKDLSEMFNQMLGAESADITIAYPKYQSLKNILEMLLKLTKIFSNSNFMKTFGFEENKAEIDRFLDKSEKEFNELFSIDFSNYEWNLTLVEEEDRKHFNETYEKMKECVLIQTFIKVCNNLIRYKKHLENNKELSYKFVNNISGVEFSPLPFTSLNFKYIFEADNIDATAKKFTLTMLGKLYTLSYDLYKEFSKPDIDVDKFVEVITSNLGEVKKRIPRCDKAFKKIEESVSMLKNNFGKYYRDFVETKQSTIIMENFILDVSNNTKADPELTLQFRKIINYYRKMASQNVTNPQVKQLFQKVEEKMKILEGNDNITRAENGDLSDDESEEDEVPLSAVEKQMLNLEEVIFSNGGKASAMSKITQFVVIARKSFDENRDNVFLCDDGFDYLLNVLTHLEQNKEVYIGAFSKFVNYIITNTTKDIKQQLLIIIAYYNKQENIDLRLRLLFSKLSYL